MKNTVFRCHFNLLGGGVNKFVSIIFVFLLASSDSLFLVAHTTYTLQLQHYTLTNAIYGIHDEPEWIIDKSKYFYLILIKTITAMKKL